jgi:hypothetical protein
MKNLKNVIFVTHKKFHIEEAFCYYVLKRRGNLIGYKIDGVQFLGSGAIKKLRDNCLYVGVGGNHKDDLRVYDEHSYDGQNTKNQSAIEILMKRHPILFSSKGMKKIAQYVHQNDSHPKTHMMELGAMLKTKFNCESVSESKMLEWCSEIFEYRLNALEFDREEYKAFKTITRRNPMSKSDMGSMLEKFSPKCLPKIKRFVLRTDFCIRDVVAVLLAKHIGKKVFGFKKSPRVDFADSADYEYRKGDLAIGFRESPMFEDLPARKMAKLLRVHPNGKFAELMRFVVNVSVRPGYHPFELPTLLTDRNFYARGDQKLLWKNYLWAVKELEPLIQKQKQYLEAKDEYHLKLQKRENLSAKITVNSLVKRIVLVETDNTMMAPYLFSDHKFQKDVVVCRNSKGHFYIATRKVDGQLYFISGIAGKLRRREMKLNNADASKISNERLYAPGTLSECPEWYYDGAQQALMNGAPTHPDISPSKISSRELFQIVCNCVKRDLQFKNRKLLQEA